MPERFDGKNIGLIGMVSLGAVCLSIMIVLMLGGCAGSQLVPVSSTPETKTQFCDRTQLAFNLSSTIVGIAFPTIAESNYWVAYNAATALILQNQCDRVAVPPTAGPVGFPTPAPIMPPVPPPVKPDPVPANFPNPPPGLPPGVTQ